MGTIVIARSLDAETQSLYNMTVQVTDGTNTATTQVGVFLVNRCYKSANFARNFAKRIFLAAVVEISKIEKSVRF